MEPASPTMPGEGEGGIKIFDDDEPRSPLPGESEGGITVPGLSTRDSPSSESRRGSVPPNRSPRALSNREFHRGLTTERRQSVYSDEVHQSVGTADSGKDKQKSTWKGKIGWAPGKREWTKSDQKVWSGEDERRKRSGSRGSFKGLSEGMRRRLSSGTSDDLPAQVIGSGRGSRVSPAGPDLGDPAKDEQSESSGCISAGQRDYLNNIMSNRYVSTFITLCTFYALFANDLRLMFAPKTADDAFTALTVIVMLLFFVELVSLSLAKRGYFLGLFFWLDLLAALSMLTEVPEVAVALQGGSDTTADDGSIFRASRAAKAGTKIGRLLKLARLIRVAKLYTRRRLNTSRWSHNRSKLTASERAHRRDSSIGSANESDLIWEDEMHAGDIAHELSEQTTSKVVIGVLFMLVVLQLIQPAGPSILQSAEYEGLCHICQNHTISVGQSSSTVERYKSKHKDGLFFLQIGDDIFLDDRSSVRYSELRTDRVRSAHELEIFQYTCTDDASAQTCTSIFDVRSSQEAEALSSILMTCFIIFVLGVGSVSFGRDAKNFAEKIAEPLRALEYDMSLVSKMKLNNDVQHPSSDLYEVRKIQQSFEVLRASLQSFSKYVPSKVVRLLMSQGREAKLGVDPRTLTILFSDIAGFTTMCETMAPQDLLVLISDYFEVMSAVVEERRGTLGEFIGDAILAFWNAPEAVTEHAAECVRTALLMHSKLEGLRRMWESRGYPDVRIRIGVHTARVFVGNLGARNRMKYGILGDGVNLASRLEELNKRYNTQLLVSEDTYKAIQPYLPDLTSFLGEIDEEDDLLLSSGKYTSVGGNDETEGGGAKDYEGKRNDPKYSSRTQDTRHTLGMETHKSTKGFAKIGYRNSVVNIENIEKLLTDEAVVAPRLIQDSTPSDKRTPEFLCRPVDAVIVKGRSKATPVYEVMNIGSDCNDPLLCRVAAHHSEAVRLYFDRDFEACMRHLRKVMSLRPDVQDVAAQVLYERAALLAENPPGDDWNGVDVLTEKHFEAPQMELSSAEK